jgi:hypothetical protein
MSLEFFENLKGVVTPNEVERYIDSVRFEHGKQTTVCYMTTVSGFEIIGTSGTIDPANGNVEVGRRLAEENARQILWGHLAFTKQFLW